MNHRKIPAIMMLCALFANTAWSSDDWPYPQDIPVKQAVSVGMASDRPVDISRFLMVRGASSVTMNKDGSLLAYISNVTGRRQLWVIPTAGGQANQLTYGNGITFYRWHPDGQHLLYAADNEGNEKEAYYLISADGKREQEALPFGDGYRQFGSFDETGARFSYASTERNGLDFDIYLHDAADGNSKMVFQAEFGYFPAAFQPGRDRLLVTQTRGEDANNLYMLDLDGGKLTTLFKPDIASEYSNFAWLKDGSGFYFASNQDREMTELMFYDMVTSKTITLHESNSDTSNIVLCSDDRYLLWTTNELGYSVLHKQDRKSNEVSTIDLKDGVYNLYCNSTSDKAIVRISAFDSPSTVVKLDLASNQQRTILEADMAGIDQSTLVSPEVISFPARDGVTLHGLLYLPPGDGKTLPPLVVDIHGGPTAQSRPAWQPLTQYLVGKGIAVLDINVRGSTGYGKTYARLDNQEKRLDSVRDLVDALTWLKQNGRVDADRAAAMGGSYGGYMVNAVMGAYPDAFKAGASFVGVADWVRALQTASPGLKASDLIEYGDIREAKWQEFYAQNSPVNTINQIKAPMLFQHGVNDPRDPVTESDTMVKALRDRQIPVTYLRFPDEGHSVRKLENRVIFYRELANFLETHL